MQTKEDLLQSLQVAINSGILTRQDVLALLSDDRSVQKLEKAGSRLSVVQSLFYIGGIILFAAVLSVVAQTWNDGAMLHIFLTIVLGLGIWCIAYFLNRRDSMSDVRQGMVDALLLTGSLLLIAGGYIVINIFGGYERVDFFEAVPALAILAAAHAGFYYSMRRDLLFLLSILLGVSAVGALLFGVLSDADVSMNWWLVAVISLAGLLSWATHVLSRTMITANHLRASYDKSSIIFGLLAMYIGSFGDLAGLWYFVILIAVGGVFYLSIVSRQKVLLGTASTFLVLTIVTIAFRYFSAFGVTTSLILSAIAILATAAGASQLSKRYLS